MGVLHDEADTDCTGNSACNKSHGVYSVGALPKVAWVDFIFSVLILKE